MKAHIAAVTARQLRALDLVFQISPSPAPPPSPLSRIFRQLRAPPLSIRHLGNESVGGWVECLEFASIVVISTASTNSFQFCAAHINALVVVYGEQVVVPRYLAVMRGLAPLSA